MGNTRTLAHPHAARLGRGGERGYASDFQKVDRAPSARMMKSGHAFGMDDAKTYTPSAWMISSTLLRSMLGA
jgi:hypothetical protein